MKGNLGTAWGGSVGVLAWLSIGAAAWGQVCPTAPAGDLMPTNISSQTNWGGLGDIRAFTVGMDICNAGGGPLPFDAAGTTQRQGITTSMYRYSVAGGVGMFEQIGMGWVHYAPELIQVSRTCVCTPAAGLGAGCCSSEGSGTAGDSTTLGPRWEINAATGGVPAVAANPPGGSSFVRRRVQFRTGDISGSAYFVEVQGVGPGDSIRHNSFSYRRASVTPGAFNILLTGSTVPGQMALEAWRVLDPEVIIASTDVPADGRFLVASRATELEGNRWHYEYAVMNVSSHASARGLRIPLAAGVLVGGVGFHDVDYHSGDGPGGVTVSGTDWAATVSEDSVTWLTQTFAENEAANALRWGTVYNFRFISNAPPTAGAVELTPFRPGFETIVVGGVRVPDMAQPCPCEYDRIVGVSSSDFFAFLQAFFDGTAGADVDGSGSVDSTDFFEFLACFFEGC